MDCEKAEVQRSAFVRYAMNKWLTMCRCLYREIVVMEKDWWWNVKVDSHMVVFLLKLLWDGWLLCIDWVVEVNRRMEGKSEWFDWRRYVVDWWGHVEWGDYCWVMALKFWRRVCDVSSLSSFWFIHEESWIIWIVNIDGSRIVNVWDCNRIGWYAWSLYHYYL